MSFVVKKEHGEYVVKNKCSGLRRGVRQKHAAAQRLADSLNRMQRALKRNLSVKYEVR
jgi:hypothetical protein